MPNSYISRTATEPQHENRWTPPDGVLGELVASSSERAAALRVMRSRLEQLAARQPRPRPFLDALAGTTIAVVAEIKRSSPSRGAIRSDLDAAEQAAAYARGGARAISVLTEPTRFSGVLADLESASTAVAIPLLRKDFIVSEEQVLEARAAGASAVLLIVRALPPATVSHLVAFCRSVELEPLVEVGTRAELGTALASGARAIGVNARNLETLAVDRDAAIAVIAHVPRDCFCIAESGLSGRSDVEAAAASGADAVLVGSALSAANDPEAAVRALTGVPKSVRGAGR